MVRRLLNVLALVGLLLVPLAVSGHGHHDGSPARDCASCLVAHHAPALASPVGLAAEAPLVRASAPVLPEEQPANDGHDRPCRGRAPPRRLSSVS